MSPTGGYYMMTNGGIYCYIKPASTGAIANNSYSNIKINSGSWSTGSGMTSPGSVSISNTSKQNLYG